MKEYIAKKVDSKMEINDSRWELVPVAKVDFVWENSFPSPFTTEARLVHSDEGITVKLSTSEWPITVTAMELNSCVCEDSCMEFFFAPDKNERDYINFEVNPAGVTLTCKGAAAVPRTELDTHNTGVKVESMIFPEEGWCVLLFIPYSFILKYYSHIDREFSANFYKCGNDTAVRHYSAWNPMGTPIPDYHHSEFFGKIILSDEGV